MGKSRAELDRPGEALAPQMERVAGLRLLYPDIKFSEIAEKLGISVSSALNHWASAKKRMGRDEVEGRFDLQAAVDQGKAIRKTVDRKVLSGKFLGIADTFVDAFEELEPDKVREMIESNPQKMMITAAVAVDKADKLEDRPTQRVVVYNVSEVDDEMTALLAEYQKREDETVDLQPDVPELGDGLDDTA